MNETLREAAQAFVDATEDARIWAVLTDDGTSGVRLFVPDGVLDRMRDARNDLRAALATPPVPAGRECDDCNGEGWTAYTTADLMPSGEPGEPYQVQQTCDTCGGRDLETQLVLRAGHLPTCGDGAEFPWDCTCDYAGFMDRIVAALRPTPKEVR